MDRDGEIALAWRQAMMGGDFEAAWLLGDEVIARRGAAMPWHLPRHLRWVWDGSPLDGRRVLVRCYHGLGDTLQMARLWPRLGTIASSVTVQVQPCLLPLLRGIKGVDHWLSLDEGESFTGFDVAVESLELAHALRLRLSDLPGPVPYLPRPERAARIERRPARLAVGLVVQGGDWDPRRAVPPELLKPIAASPDVDCFSLQRGPAAASLEEALGAALRNPGHRDEDIVATAADILALDLVITVDTMVAHLAGGLGAPVWSMLHSDPDWRWMAEGDACPWYPTMRLFRQERAGDWRPVVDRISARLAADIHRLKLPRTG